MIDLELNSDGDLLIENYDLKLISGADQVIQNIAIRLRFFLGEWFLDTTTGVPYLQDIFIKAPNQIRVENIFKQTILDTKGITEITNFFSEYDEVKRKFSIIFSGIAEDESFELEVQAP